MGRPKQEFCQRGHSMAESRKTVGSDGHSRCGVCAVMRNKERSKTGAAKLVYRRSKLKKYGLTLEQFDALLQEQCGCCAICGTTEWGGGSGQPAVDHCHVTGAVRGILCHGCNWAIGHFGDNPIAVESAARYLRRQRG